MLLDKATLADETPEARAERLARMRAYYAANKDSIREKDRRWRANNPGRVKYLNRAAVLRPYGLTPEDYDVRLSEQSYGCAICGRPPWECRGLVLAVDHNHTTGKVRGLLCTWCNAGIGNFLEDEGIMARAATSGATGDP